MISSTKISERKPPLTALSASYQMTIVFPNSVQHLLTTLVNMSWKKEDNTFKPDGMILLKKVAIATLPRISKRLKDVFLTG